jgi:hypothetical protein
MSKRRRNVNLRLPLAFFGILWYNIEKTKIEETYLVFTRLFGDHEHLQSKLLVLHRNEPHTAPYDDSGI